MPDLCRYCNAKLRWVTDSYTGSRVPLDLIPNRSGDFAIKNGEATRLGEMGKIAHGDGLLYTRHDCAPSRKALGKVR